MRAPSLALILGPTAAVVFFACTGDEPVNVGGNGPDASTPTRSDASSGGPTDAGKTDPDTGSIVDAGPCNPAADFGRPTMITAASSLDPEQQPTLTEDERMLFFVRTGKVYFTMRESRDVDFTGAAVEVAEVNADATKYWQSAGITRDGQTLVLGTKQLFISRLDAGKFGTPQPITGDGDIALSGEHAYVNHDQSAVYFNTVPDVPPLIKRATILSATAWSNVATLTELGAKHSDRYPVVSDDELTLYFASRRSDAGTGDDVYVSKRANKKDAWGSPSPLPGVNGEGDEAPSWLSSDGCRLYLVISGSGSINTDIYVATKPH